MMVELRGDAEFEILIFIFMRCKWEVDSKIVRLLDDVNLKPNATSLGLLEMTSYFFLSSGFFFFFLLNSKYHYEN